MVKPSSKGKLKQNPNELSIWLLPPSCSSFFYRRKATLLHVCFPHNPYFNILWHARKKVPYRTFSILTVSYRGTLGRGRKKGKKWTLIARYLKQRHHDSIVGKLANSIAEGGRGHVWCWVDWWSSFVTDSCFEPGLGSWEIFRAKTDWECGVYCRWCSDFDLAAAVGAGALCCLLNVGAFRKLCVKLWWRAQWVKGVYHKVVLSVHRDTKEIGYYYPTRCAWFFDISIRDCSLGQGAVAVFGRWDGRPAAPLSIPLPRRTI